MKFRPFLIVALVLILVQTTACRDKGCTDSYANNYRITANYDDGTCEYTYGCMDSNAVNFNIEATIDDRTCVYEFISTDETFQDFIEWTKVDSNVGPDPFATGSHGSNDSTVVRDVFFYENAKAVNGKYKNGTRIVKYSHSETSGFFQLTAMAKRGNNFDPDHNDWEWLVLNPNGTIAEDSIGQPLRGKNALNQFACASCHYLSETDFVFSK